MYIQPQSKVYILRGVKLDSTYQNTIHFNSRSEQQSFFIGKAKYQFNNYSYLRKERAIRVEVNPDDLFDCNYIMFQNTGYGNKWFYAFIDRVEWVNNVTANIHYTIDVMQTWWFDINIGECFVLREHSATDNVGDNLLNDNLETGEYTTMGFTMGTNKLNNCYIVLASTLELGPMIETELIQGATGQMIGRIYQGAHYYAFDPSAIADLNSFLNKLTITARSSSIVGLFMYPKEFFTAKKGSGDWLEYEGTGSAKEIDIDPIKKPYNNIDGYTPNNKKLFTYPYNYLYVTNLEGVSANYRYEDFSGTDCVFSLTGDISPAPTFLLTPKNYKNQDINFNEAIHMKNFPQCSYNIDSFMAWVSQSAIPDVLNAVTFGALTSKITNTDELAQMTDDLGRSYIGGSFTNEYSNAYGSLTNTSTGFQTAGNVQNMVSGSELGVSMLGASMVAHAVSSTVEHAMQPPQMKGSLNGYALFATSRKDFAIYYACIKREYAQIIDRYWDMYGYPTNTLKIPNISNRPKWNYIKVGTANITGSIPSPDLTLIKKIFMTGITFWKDGNNVGNYGDGKANRIS